MSGLARTIPTAARDSAYLAVGLLAVIAAFAWIRWSVDSSVVGFDFRGTLWDSGTAVREGRSPYPEPVLEQVDVGNPAIYPPLMMLLVAPLTAMPWEVGLGLWLAVLAGALVASLAILNVRDVRCYAAALLSAPVINGLLLGNVTLLLLPLVALAWRWRNQWVRSGVVVGLAIASKLFLWPLLFWLLGTRRYRAAGVALLASIAGILVPWAAIGFDGLVAYRDLLRVAEEIYAVHSHSVATMASALGVPASFATGLAIAFGGALALLALVVGRSGREEIAVSLAVVAAILGSPIVWEYYYALLFVPLAILWPRFSWVWLLPLLVYVTHRLPRPKLPAAELEPGGSACCKPEGVPLASWVFNHAPPGLWPALGHALVAMTVLAMAFVVSRRQHGADGEAARSPS